ncbi:MAG TPA: MDR family MFS transporter [Acidimicrobiales bacterium]|jgi:EmrB/QacA subfamily drug resistance transporter|nr:MDR family MFS transporter [Acidimicrobiales bacterium]
MTIETPPRPADGAEPSVTAPPPIPGAGLSHRQVLIIFSGLMLGMFLAALDQTIVGTALPTIVNSLHGLNHISWVVTAYLLTSTISTPLYGKLSDQLGRKGIFQFAIVIFLVGSVLAGLSQNMGELIAFRGIQGIGAGGLMSMAMTIIADVVSPRDRGRYQGYFGATFALSSVAGPLLGGVFTDNLSWRWIFYINIPIGIVALCVTSVVLKLPFRRQAHDIDYLGAVLLMVAITATLLVTVWGGTQYPWGSPEIIALGAAAAAFVTAFILWERRASEPILPPSLFRVGIFRVSSGVSFLLAMVMFGAIIYLPLYLQLVDGVSAMVSGLLLIPLMLGLLVASIGSGQIVTRTGRYKIFPVVGSILVIIGMYLLSQLGLHTSHLVMSLYVIVLGAGMGMTMQIMVLATQNAVAPTQIGTATAAVTFFRSLGGAFGTSLFGAIFIAGLGHWIPVLVPGAVGRALHVTGNFSMSPTQLHGFPAAVQHGILESFVRSLHSMFLVGVPIAVAMCVLTLFLREVKLRTSSGLERPSEDVAMTDALAGSADAEFEEGALGTGVSIG